MGKELKNNKEDSAKTLVSLYNFLDPAFRLGDRQGDEKLFDGEGNYDMPKEEVVSEPEIDPNQESNSSDEEDEAEEGKDMAEPGTPEQAVETEHYPTESQTVNQTDRENDAEPENNPTDTNRETETESPDSDSDIEIIGEIKKGIPPIIDIDDTTTEEKSNKIKVEPKQEPEPSTSSASADITSILEQIKQLSSVVQRLAEVPTTIVEGPQNPRPVIKKEEPKETDPATSKPPEKEEEPKEAEPATGETPESDTDEFIRGMQKHIASIEKEPTTQKTQTQEVSPEQPKKTQPEQTDESDSGTQGIEEVISSTSSEEEVFVDPTKQT